MTIESLQAKSARLLEAIKRLELVRGRGLDHFLVSPLDQDASLYNLVIAIEAITDIGNHILSTRFQDYADQYKQVLQKLGQHGVVSTELVDRTIHMAGFRNLAIHVYEGLEMEKVYDILDHAPDEFRAYAEALVKFF